MSEARDRVSRPGDVMEMFSRRRRSFGAVDILVDEPGGRTPFRWGATALTGAIGNHNQDNTNDRGAAVRGGVVFRRGSLGTRRFGNGRRWSVYGTPARFGRENTPVGSGRRGLGSRSVLPSWYPRKPLNDVTTVVQAIQRRRDRLREIDGHQLESPLSQDENVHFPLVSTLGAPIEHDLSLISPSPTIAVKRFPPTVGKVPKILLDITNQNAGGSDFLTPEKKLLNSIDAVEKVVMVELQRLKRTPTAKKAEREKKVRTLMSMR